MDKDNEVVCISDEECESQKFHPHRNVYEVFIPPGQQQHVAPAVQAQLASSLRERKKKKRSTRNHENNLPPTPVLIYVPDDKEEEEILIDPIRQICHKIMYPDMLNTWSTFPYNLLEEIYVHMRDKVKDVSLGTEGRVWTCVMEQLACVRIMYAEMKVID